MQIISYKEARAKGLKRYFTGNPCKNGHISERMVSHCGCIECAYERTRKWGQENPELKLASYRDWIDRHPEYGQQWVKKNRLSRRRTTSKWYQKNSDLSIKRALEWAKDHPERIRTAVRNRTAKRKAAGGSHTTEEILALLDRQDWKCVSCGACLRKKRHIDHIMPLCLGGSNNISNLQGLCPRCNCSKNARHPDEWMKEIKLLQP